MFASKLLEMTLIPIRTQDRPARSLLATPTIPQLLSGVYYCNVWLEVPVVKLLTVQFFQSNVAS